MVETIKRVLGIHVINHVFVTSFPKFKRAVDEMGCVYMTVDKRYYHVNEPGGEQYFEINLQPGYQRLCGAQALEFVANRHESTSLIRDARDQRFLLEVKAEYGATLFENREKFEKILGKAMETDLHGEEPVLQLLELLVESAGKPVRQVPFHVTLLPTVDTASPEQITEAVRSFLNGTSAISTHKVSQAVKASQVVKTSRARAHTRHAAPHLSLTPTSGEALMQARAASPQLPFPLEYPRVRDAFASAEADTLRVYTIHDRHGHPYTAYVIVIDRGGLGEYYDVQGSSWTEPPLLNNPSQTVQIGSRTYDLYYAGEEIRMIAWHEAGAAYWIQNTLTNGVGPREMLAMAEHTLPVIATRRTPPATTIATPHSVNLPPREFATTSLSAKLAAALGFVGLGVVGLLSLVVILRRRELNRLREQVAHAIALEARQRPLLASGAGAAGVLGSAGWPDPPHPGPGSGAGDAAPTIHRVGRRWRAGVLAVGGVAIAGLVAAAALMHML